jgi:hypothetical protein
MYSIALVQYSTAVRVAPPAMAAVVVAAVVAGPGVTRRQLRYVIKRRERGSK